MWHEANDLSDEQLQREHLPFKIFSGKYQCRILGQSNDGEYHYLLGSGGYLSYRGRHFLVTNKHVVQETALESVCAFCVSEGTQRAELIDVKVDQEQDIAAYEIDANCIELFRGKEFLTETLIERNPETHLVNHNPVFLHASPGATSEIDFDEQEVRLTTFPYLTFAKRFTNDFFVLDINRLGENELREVAEIPAVAGMSGSWAYCHYNDGIIPYKCIGIICCGERDSGNLWVLHIGRVLDFIDERFFVY